MMNSKYEERLIQWIIAFILFPIASIPVTILLRLDLYYPNIFNGTSHLSNNTTFIENYIIVLSVIFILDRMVCMYKTGRIGGQPCDFPENNELLQWEDIDNE